MAVKHVVLLKFKPGTTDRQIARMFADLADLRRHIRGLEEFIGGPNSSVEGLNQGYTHGFIMTFTDAGHRDAYLPHPEHERVKATILPHVEAIVAFDFDASATVSPAGS